MRKFDEEYITENDLSSLRTIYLAGEPLDEATYEWMNRVLGEDIAIIDNYWQTEIFNVKEFLFQTVDRLANISESLRYCSA